MREGFVKWRRVGAAMALLFGAAPIASAQSRIGGYVNLGAGIRQPSPSTFTRTAVNAEGSDREEAKTVTELESSAVFDFGGGIVLADRFTLGASYERSSSKQPTEVQLSLSHPEFHPTLVATKATNDLKRTDTAAAFAVRVSGDFHAVVHAHRIRRTVVHGDPTRGRERSLRE